MKKTALAFIFAVFFPLCLQAGDYLIEITPDKKVLIMENMGLSPNTSVKDVLHMVPELLDRGGENYFSNFDIQIDGKSVGNGRDVVLEHMKVSEISKVEISTSPTASQQKNGQGGTINLVLAKLSEGLSGEVYFTTSTIPDVMPSVNLNYKKGKLELWSSLNLEYYAPTIGSDLQDITPGKEVVGQDKSHKDVLLETAKVNMKYSFSSSDVLKAWVIENYIVGRENRTAERTATWDKSSQQGDGWLYREESTKNTSLFLGELKLMTMAEYEHTFRKDFKFKVSAGYEGSRRDEGSTTSSNTDVSETTTPRSVDTEIRLEVPLFSNGDNTLILKTGLNTILSSSVNSFRAGHTLYESPFLEFKYVGKKVSANLGARYQYDSRRYGVAALGDYFSTNHDFTANLNLLWQVVDHHALRFIASRDLIKPNDAMLYPELVYNRSTGIWTKGNNMLYAACLHTAKACYIHDWTDGRHNVVFNTEIGYTRADGLIEEYGEYDKERDIFYNTYRNTGISNIIETDISLFYGVGIFSFAFSSNIFHSSRKTGGERDQFTYVNLSLTPVFRFHNQWTLSGRVLYNSPVIKVTSTLGDCLYAQLRLSKTIRKWTIFSELSDVFDYQSYDVTNEIEHKIMTRYDMYKRNVMLGFSYKF